MTGISLNSMGVYRNLDILRTSWDIRNFMDFGELVRGCIFYCFLLSHKLGIPPNVKLTYALIGPSTVNIQKAGTEG